MLINLRFFVFCIGHSQTLIILKVSNDTDMRGMIVIKFVNLFLFSHNTLKISILEISTPEPKKWVLSSVSMFVCMSVANPLKLLRPNSHMYCGSTTYAQQNSHLESPPLYLPKHPKYHFLIVYKNKTNDFVQIVQITSY